jgi:predicted nucleic acid-binding protein
VIVGDRAVVDANVYVKLFVTEEHSELAEYVFASVAEILAPEFIGVEAASVFVKKVKQGLFEQADARRPLLQLPGRVQLIRGADLYHSAFQISLTSGASAYDSLYLALAIREDCPLVSADQRLFERMAGHYPGRMLPLNEVTFA